MQKKFAFVLMPFAEKFSDTYRLGIKAAAEENEIHAERVDEQIFHKEGILARIYSQIEAADIIVADMTDQNPNVFYEVGYAHAKEKTCILLTNRSSDIPFDLKHHRHIVYESISTLKERLSSDFAAIIQKDREQIDSITVDMSVGKWSDLKNMQYAMYGVADFMINIHASKNTSTEIEAIYIYTSGKWNFTQDNTEVHNTQSDMARFEKRHLIKCPIRRLTKNNWIPIKIKGNKLLEYRKKGEEFKAEYQSRGQMGIRISTSEKDIDLIFDLETQFSDAPF